MLRWGLHETNIFLKYFSLLPHCSSVNIRWFKKKKKRTQTHWTILTSINTAVWCRLLCMSLDLCFVHVRIPSQTSCVFIRSSICSWNVKKSIKRSNWTKKNIKQKRIEHKGLQHEFSFSKTWCVQVWHYYIQLQYFWDPSFYFILLLVKLKRSSVFYFFYFFPLWCAGGHFWFNAHVWGGDACIACTLTWTLNVVWMELCPHLPPPYSPTQSADMQCGKYELAFKV